jgi:prepilin-type N-terminal cleavage/methylation domain-containing protein
MNADHMILKKRKTYWPSELRSNFSLINKLGFTLIELMVAVAIIGILAAISALQVMKYSAKSRQSEAKTHLALLYTSEKTFQSEFSVYDPNFFLVGFGIVGGTRYNVGFASGGDTAASISGVAPPAATAVARDLITYCPQSFSSDIRHFLKPKFLFSSLLLEKAFAGPGGGVGGWGGGGGGWGSGWGGGGGAGGGGAGGGGAGGGGAGGGGAGGGGAGGTSCWVINGADAALPDTIDATGAGYVVSGGATLYTAAATARIYPNAPSDVWTINQDKTLANVQNGIP